MSTIYLTNASPGAPQLTIADGTLVAILDWALPQTGWGVEFSSGHDRIYRAGTGRRLRLQVRDSAAASGADTRVLIRGCESATSVTALVDPFPLPSQVADALSNWEKGDATSPTVPRMWRLVLTPTFFWIAMAQTPGVSPQFDIGFFGQPPASNSEDEWATLVGVRNAGWPNFHSPHGFPLTVVRGELDLNPLNPTNAKVFWARDITGVVKSTTGKAAMSSPTFCSLSGGQAPRGGYANALNREMVGFTDSAAADGTAGATRILRRAWWPNCWNPLHGAASGGLTSANTFSDTAYNPAASFIWCAALANFNFIMETTNTWVAPTHG